MPLVVRCLTIPQSFPGGVVQVSHFQLNDAFELFVVCFVVQDHEFRGICQVGDQVVLKDFQLIRIWLYNTQRKRSTHIFLL